MILRTSLVVSMVVACGSSNAQPDAVIADAAVDAPSAKLMFSGVALDSGGTQPVGGATVTIKERPGITTSTAADGSFKIELIAEQTMTVMLDAQGYPRTIQRPIVFHASQGGSHFQMLLVNQAEFDALNTAGGAASGAGIVAVTVIPLASCLSDGSGVVLSSNPSSGTVKRDQRSRDRSGGDLDWIDRNHDLQRGHPGSLRDPHRCRGLDRDVCTGILSAVTEAVLQRRRSSHRGPGRHGQRDRVSPVVDEARAASAAASSPGARRTPRASSSPLAMARSSVAARQLVEPFAARLNSAPFAATSEAWRDCSLAT